jgi:hypothetical protein
MSLISCKKEDSHHEMAASGTVTISKPYEQQTFAKGDTIHVDAKLVATTPLHGYTINIVTMEGDPIFTRTEHVHSNEINLHESWVNTVSGSKTLELTVSSELDHHGNDIKKAVKFKVQ